MWGRSLLYDAIGLYAADILAKKLTEVILETISTLVNCPSCGHSFCVLAPDVPADLQTAAAVEWAGGPDIECPQCKGHSPRSAFLILPENSLPDQIVETDEDAEEDNTPSGGLSYIDGVEDEGQDPAPLDEFEDPSEFSEEEAEAFGVGEEDGDVNGS